MKTTEMNIDPNKLKSLRNAKGWTQQHLADVSGISLRTIQRAELKGAVSVDTVSALNIVFEMKHLDWQVLAEPESIRAQVMTRGVKVALLSITITQVAALFIVWLYVGEISSLWLKLIITAWVIISIVMAIILITFKIQKVKSYDELCQLNQKKSPPKTE